MSIYSFDIAHSQVIKENNHRPFVLVNKKVAEEFSQFDQTNPDCVVRFLHFLILRWDK